MTSTSQNQGIPRTSTASTPVNSGPGIFVFEADTAAFANRKRAARACASCQKRKKRCPHTFSKSQDSPNSAFGGVGANDGAEKVLPTLTHKEPIRFVGDLNPESILTDLSASDRGAKRFSRVGTWVEQSRLRAGLLLQQQQEESNAQANAAPNTAIMSATTSDQVAKANRPTDMSLKQAAVDRYSKIERGRRTLTGHQKNYLQAVGAFRVLPKATEDALVSTYIACIDSLLPIIDGAKFLAEYSAGEASVFLVQAICLVACKTEESAPYLRLYEDGPLLDPIPFARSLHTGLDAAMKADLEADRFTKVQIMTLMSLHNDGPGGIEESSLHLVQAIHDAQTTGVHIDTPGRTRNDQGAQLWWTLWMLDKYNACLGGRPLMIAERDIDIEEPETEATPRSQSLAVWRALGHLLDKVIEFYRPISDPDATGWEQDFPSWKTLTADCDLETLLPSHQNILELCYNIIGILACRSGGPTTRSYNRRIECADRIQMLVSQGRYTKLPPIPLVPYAVSLSLTVVYRALRDHHTDPTKALADLSTRCSMLESLSKTWWTADAMAKLGRKALKSLQHPQQPQPNGRTGDAGDALEAEVHVCKYGPFTEHKLGLTTRVDPSDPESGPRKNVESHRNHGKAKEQQELTGNALHVLSDAAATHSQRKASLKPKRLLATENNNDHDLQAKRRRMKPARHSLTAIDHPTPSSTNSASTPGGSNNMDPPNITYTVATPRGPNGPTPDSNSEPPFLIQRRDPPSILSSESTTPRHQAVDLTNNPFPTFADYSDLDNLFDGFFDLSMPTMFQDPLFNGAAFMEEGVGFDDYDFMAGPNTFPQYSSGPATNTVIPTAPPEMGIGQIDPRISMNINADSFGLRTASGQRHSG